VTSEWWMQETFVVIRQLGIWWGGGRIESPRVIVTTCLRDPLESIWKSYHWSSSRVVVIYGPPSTWRSFHRRKVLSRSEQLGREGSECGKRDAA
jgi:hypothetical protein